MSLYAPKNPPFDAGPSPNLALAGLAGKLSVLPRLRPLNASEEHQRFFHKQGMYQPKFTCAPLEFGRRTRKCPPAPSLVTKSAFHFA